VQSFFLSFFLSFFFFPQITRQTRTTQEQQDKQERRCKFYWDKVTVSETKNKERKETQKEVATEQGKPWTLFFLILSNPKKQPCRLSSWTVTTTLTRTIRYLPGPLW
jgi:hypothetical protein